MTNEIKEILDYLKETDDKDIYGYVKDKILAYEEGTKLLDYITNLQEENERLKQIMLARQFPTPNAVTVKIETKEVLQQRIDKATKELKDTSVDMPSTLLIEVIDYAIHTLQGEDK